MAFRRIDIGMVPAWVGRMTYTGDLGYEIWVAPEYQRSLFDLLWEAGQPHGMAAVRVPGADVDAAWRRYSARGSASTARSTRRSKRAWTATSSSTTTSSGARRSRRSRQRGPERRLVKLEVDVDADEPADVIGDEPIWHDGDGRRLGDVRRLRPLRAAVAGVGLRAGRARRGRTTEFEIEIIGNRRPARLAHGTRPRPGRGADAGVGRCRRCASC